MLTQVPIKALSLLEWLQFCCWTSAQVPQRGNNNLSNILIPCRSNQREQSIFLKKYPPLFESLTHDRAAFIIAIKWFRNISKLAVTWLDRDRRKKLSLNVLLIIIVTNAKLALSSCFSFLKNLFYSCCLFHVSCQLSLGLRRHFWCMSRMDLQPVFQRLAYCL